MSRKTLIFCLAVLSVMSVALGIAIAFLYSDADGGGRDNEVSLKGARGCLAAIPSDAVLVACSSRLDKACDGFLSSFALPDSLKVGIVSGDLASLKKCPMAVSLHYSGKLIPLYVFDLGDASESAAGFLKETVDRLGCKSQRNGTYLLVSESEALVKSASRHLDIKVSILDASGFAEASAFVDGDMMLFVPHLHIRKLLSVAGINANFSFLERLADWSSFVIGDDGHSLSGSFTYEGAADEFLSVIDDYPPSVSQMAKVLPSYTISAVSLPLSDPDRYVAEYKSFIDSRQSLHMREAMQQRLKATAGILPEDFFKSLKIKEIATACFRVGGKLEKVNLIKTSSRDVKNIIFKGNETASLKGSSPQVYSWAYESFAASVFGELFQLDDESCFTFVDGWIITGSKPAIEDYVVRKSLDYTLDAYLADAGRSGLLSASPVSVLTYFSLTEDKDGLGSSLSQVSKNLLSDVMESDFAPAVLSIGKERDGLTINATIHSLTLKKTKAPVFERDTTVVIPTGPFTVRNSHTGKMNTFYQNRQKSLCLRDENGKDLWGVPFDTSICGTAWNIDYYANGKLQIIFGAGSSIYVIDRLGRYVNGFPVNIGKEILLGPDLYDFSGSKKYNIMVLHKDKTIEMYNLKGKKPDSWKGISTAETIKSLPEALVLGGRNFWIVRTSVQTLIYPFYGGEPLTVMEGDGKIRPDSEVKILDDTSVQVHCYDGKTRTLKLR